MRYSDVRNHLGHKFKIWKVINIYVPYNAAHVFCEYRCIECHCFLSWIMTKHVFETCEEICVKHIMES